MNCTVQHTEEFIIFPFRLSAYIKDGHRSKECVALLFDWFGRSLITLDSSACLLFLGQRSLSHLNVSKEGETNIWSL